MNHTQNLHLPQWEADDRIMRTDFNEAMASIDAALKAANDAMPRIMTGTYTGDGVNGRVINLGATPKAVIVKNEKSYAQFFHTNEIMYAPAIAVTGSAGNVVTIIDGGFRLTDHGLVNKSGEAFLYIAFV